jgi:hypothetical protein
MKVGAGLLLLAMLAASPEIRYFRYERPIETKSGQSCVVLDTGIFPHALPQLADLRLYRGDAETPFAIRTAAAEDSGQKTIDPLNLGVRSGEAVFDARMPDGRYSDLHLDLKAQNFIATVTVTGSQTEAGSAETSLGNYTIFDLSSQKLGRSMVLHLPESDFPLLHFRIKGPISPQSVGGVSVLRVSTTQAKYLAVAASSQVAQKGHLSVIEFTVPANVPVDRIAFAPNSTPAQFSRNVTVTVTPVRAISGTDGDQPAQPESFSGDLLRVHSSQNGHRIDEEDLAIDAPGVDSGTPEKWTITIDNGDDAPLMLESVQLEMVERSLCFDAQAGGSYELYYGDAALAAPQYDYAKLFTLQANATELTAGSEQANPTYQPRPDERPFTEKHPALLWAALAAVILLLGAIALRSVKAATEPRG